jgi:hypothetical protein
MWTAQILHNLTSTYTQDFERSVEINWYTSGCVEPKLRLFNDTFSTDYFNAMNPTHAAEAGGHPAGR